MGTAKKNQGLSAVPLIGKNSDVMMALGVIGVLSFMMVPLPAMLLDILLSFSITFSLVIVMVAMYVMRPVEFSVFPSILLFATLLRLSLNIASTRLVLLHGNEGITAAGKVIGAFGNFLVGGNYVVGIIVFLILVVINFVVITKGAGRIAEVAARFTLDAMPGKQMSIDADLNAGLINDEEAKDRRQLISQEAEFYGAMDGASKFVRGDAVAGVLITLINIIGGLSIGVLQKGMCLADAARNFTLLTVGDGLVSQVPALIVSTAAGIVVSRAAAESDLGREITSQILLHPRAIGVASAVIFCFALIPGLPSLPFMLMALVTGAIAFTVFKAEKARIEEERVQEKAATKARSQERAEGIPPLDILELEVGYGLIHLVDAEQDGELLERIKTIRRRFAQEVGVLIPPIHIRDNLQLKPNEYSILLKGNEIAKEELMLNYYLAMNPGTAEENIVGVPTKEPTFGLPALWIKEEEKERALSKGYTVVDAATVLTTHLSEVIRTHAHELLGRQEVQQLIEAFKESNPKLVEELIPNLFSLGGLVRVLQNLLREQIPIRDLRTILESLADYAPMTKDIDILTEYVRQALARTITKLYRNVDGKIPLITLDQEVEKAISLAIQRGEQGSYLAMEPNLAQKIINNIIKNLERFSPFNCPPIILCSSQVRIHFKKFVDRFIPNLVVLSYNELLSSAKIQSLGTVDLPNAD